MPIYEYRCRKCDKIFSHLHRKFDEPALACPDCGGDDTRLFSTFSAGTAGTKNDCPHADNCAAAHSHGPGCGCGCCGHHH